MTTQTTYHTIRTIPSPKLAGESIPVIIVEKEDGTFLREAWQLFHEPEYTQYSAAWRSHMAKSIGMFFDFFKANGSPDLNDRIKANRIINDYITAVRHGTLQADGTCPHGLYWHPVAPSLQKIRLQNLRTFLEKLEDLVEDEQVTATRFVKTGMSSLAHEKRKNNSLLYHIARAPKNTEVARKTAMTSVSKFNRTTPFPADVLVKLIEEGCRLQRSKTEFYDINGNKTIASEYNINLLLAVLMMAGLGVRKSELFHLYLEDVKPEGIYFYHPEYGVMESGETREAYLKKEFGLLPRNKLGGTSQFAGWKSFLVDDAELMRSKAFFLTNTYRQMVYGVFAEYRRYVTPDNPSHPFLFVSTDRDNYGEPWTVNALNAAFKTALAKIKVKSSQLIGTNIHGLRHSYGQSLVNMGLSPLIIQRCMHHTSMTSQEAYTRPSSLQIDDALKKAAQQIEGHIPYDDSEKMPDLIGFNYQSDPAGIFAPYSLGINNDRI